MLTLLYLQVKKELPELPELPDLELGKWIEEYTGLSEEVQSKILASFFTLFIVLIIRKVVLKLMEQLNTGIRRSYWIRNTVNYITFGIGGLLIGRIWFEGFHSIVTYLGLLSAGIAIALKEPITNLAGWVFILFRRPFEVGDRLEVGGVAGDVIDVGLFQFTLNEIGNWVDADQSTGRIVMIPNSKVFTEAQANYTKGFPYIWSEISVLVTYESDWEVGKELLGEIAMECAGDVIEQAEKDLRNVSQQYLLLYTKLTPIVYTTTESSGVKLTMRYLCKPRQRRGVASRIWERILLRFAETDNLDLAYDTIRRI